MNNNEDIIDVNYQELDDDMFDKEINGSPMYYTRSQVARILDEPADTIGYWSRTFGKYLNIAISNKNRVYTKKNIEQLKFIKKLKREDGLTTKQIEEYCSEKGFTEDGLIDQSKPLAIKVVTEALLAEMNTQLAEFKKDMTKQVAEILIESQKLLLQNNEIALNNIKDEICVTVDEVVSEKMNEKIKNINSSIKETIKEQQDEFINKLDKREEEAKKRLLEIDNNLKKSMEEQKRQFTEIQNSNKKSFFSRLFS